jgi:hypothetical protein
MVLIVCFLILIAFTFTHKNLSGELSGNLSGCQANLSGKVVGWLFGLSGRA